MVERSIRIRQVAGSMPALSKPWKQSSVSEKIEKLGKARVRFAAGAMCVFVSPCSLVVKFSLRVSELFVFCLFGLFSLLSDMV